MNLNKSVTELSGIGSATEKKLNKLGIKTIKDLLFHFPHRWEDFSNFKKISQLQAKEKVSICAQVKSLHHQQTPRKRIFLSQALVEDKSGSFRLVWFNRPYLSRNLKEENWAIFSGAPKRDKNGLCLTNPVYERIKDSIGQKLSRKISENKTPKSLKPLNIKLTHVGRLIPVYPETHKLTSHQLRFWIKNILKKVHLKEWLPPKIKQKNNLINLNKAIAQIHFPESKSLAQKARYRLAFNELFLLQLATLKRKRDLKNKNKAPQIKFRKKLIKDFVDNLPFNLTDAQRKAAWEILQDLEKSQPMNRLLEGDVGSGKTVVAAIAALQTTKEGYQTALMAPTEILAKQHYETFSKLLKKEDVKISLRTASTTNKETQDSNIIIGTHALIQKKVSFQDLGLVIIDEQHRFGVKQRAALQNKSRKIKDKSPHFLTMTATPIPRTLSLTLYGDLDISILDELPKGRQEIITRVVKPKERSQTYEFVGQQIKEGRQVFVICPLIEESEKLETKSVEKEYQRLNQKVFPNLTIGQLHGKLKDKQKVMQEFARGAYDILVATSVIEVGIDVPNASVMIIEGAERFGLAQLHQFRGRVGRGEHQSYCLLFTQSHSKKTWARLKAITNCQDGFQLAEKDLQIRGPGQFIGTRQSGLPDLSMASLKNKQLIEKTRQQAQKILPEIDQYPQLKEKLSEFNQKIHLE